jgi:TadE-like protein
VPLLLMLLFGIIDYGIYFSDGLAAQGGVQAAARRGVVTTCDTSDCLSDIADLVRQDTDTVAGGQVFVSVAVVRGSPGAPSLSALATSDEGDGGVGPGPPTWSRANDLLVCSVVEVGGLTGVVEALTSPTPVELFPNGGTVRSKARMRIEQVGIVASPAAYPQEILPSGTGDWSFCS